MITAILIVATAIAALLIVVLAIAVGLGKQIKRERLRRMAIIKGAKPGDMWADDTYITDGVYEIVRVESGVVYYRNVGSVSVLLRERASSMEQFIKSRKPTTKEEN